MTTQHPEALHHTKYLTAVYRDINPGDEARELITHPKMTAASWSHVMDERDRLRSENETLQAGYDAARLEIESLQARIKTMAEEHADELMVAHMDGMRAAQPAPQQEAQEPVAWYVTGCSRLLDEDEAKAEARHIGGTARAMPLYTAPQPSPAAQGDALSDETVRVPLDSLHADAAYLIGRLREGSMPYARVIEIIRERIDAAKAAIRARAAQGDIPDVVDVPDQCPYFGPSPHRDVWLAGWYAARAAQEGK